MHIYIIHTYVYVGVCVCINNSTKRGENAAVPVQSAYILPEKSQYQLEVDRDKFKILI